MNNNNNLFWVSYSDIMTSLFFIMLVLFVITAGYYYNRYQITQDKLNEIKAIETALSSLDRSYFNFDEESKRYRLNIPVEFSPNNANIYEQEEQVLEELNHAGNALYNRLDSLLQVNEQTHLLLVIEGNTQRSGGNHKLYPDIGYKLSYKRALALYNYWKNDSKLDFRTLTDKYSNRFELIIAGSGYFGLNREPDGSPLNRRFTLQITSKYTLEATN
ncbi:MAG: hypothetical protein U5K72_04425 [Balneolaceae bacterium]|nr:hypothetical protein [Balneolaceae bacterium]